MNQRKSGVILSYISLALNGAIGFIYVPLLLRYMGQSEYGLYQLMGSVIAYFSVMDFGMSSTVIRYYSKYKALGDRKNMENILALSSVIYAVITVLITIAGIICYFNLGNIFSASLTAQELESAKKIFGVLLVNIAITIPSKIFDAVIVSNERFVFLKLATIVQIVAQPFVVIAVMQEHPYALSFVAVQTAFNIALVIVKIIYSGAVLKIKIKIHNYDKVLFREMMGFSFFVFLGAIMDQVFWRTNTVVLGIVANTAVVAVYGVSMTIFNTYMSLSTVITSVFLPRVTSLVAVEAPEKKLSDMFIKIGRLQFLLLSCVLSGFILFGRQFIEIWTKDGFDDAYLITLCLIIPFTVDLIQNIGITILQAENRLAFRSVIFLSMAVVNIGISIPMAKYYGAIGCAFSTGLTFLIMNVIMNFYYNKQIGIDIKTFWKDMLRIALPCVIVMVPGYFINKISFGGGVVNLIFKIGLYMCVFVPVMWFFAMNSFEKGLVKSVLLKFKKILVHR